MPVPLLEPSRRETVALIRRRVMAVDGVRGCDVHIDTSGKKPRIRLRVLLEGTPGYEKTHRISSMVDHQVRKVVPNVRLSIRSAPESGDSAEDEGLWQLVKRIADREPGSRGAHNIHLENLGGKLGVDFHLEVSSGMSVNEAYEVAANVERKLRSANPKISEVVIHQETALERVSSERSGHGSELVWYVGHLMTRFPEATLSRRPVVRSLTEGQVHVIIHASFPPDLGIERANQVASRLEASLKSDYPAIGRVDVVQEPKASGTHSRPSMSR